ncbi:MAG: hypothetical protein AAB858_01200, partial [Patescibacteria group bacterium]
MKNLKENSMAYSERTINWSNAFFRAETKKFLKYGLVGIIVVFGFFGPVSLDFRNWRAITQEAKADTHAGLNCPAGQKVNPESGACYTPVPSNNPYEGLNYTKEEIEALKKGTYSGPEQTAEQSAAQITPPPAGTRTTLGVGKCGSWLSVISSPIDCGLASLANLFLTIVSRLLYLAGILFNYSMSFTLNLADYAKSLNIDATWGIVRDLVNITFIFSLLWIAAATILELGDHKKFLTGLIIAALLINFSLFFTKVIIDISNTIALQFYSSITAGQFNNPNADLDGGISGQFMERLKLQTIYAIGGKGGDVAAELRSQGPQLLSMTSVFMVTIFGSIFFLVAAAVFFSAALMFVARSAMLILLMVTSPIGFIGGWIPKLKTYADMWWEQLWSQSMLAPVFLMLIWVILKMTEPRTIGGAAATSGGSSPNTAAALTAAAGDSLVNNSGSAMASAVGTKSTVSFATALSGSDGSSVAIIFNFFILMAFLIAALTVAKTLSGQAGKGGAKMFGTVAGGVGGFLGRHTVGRLASKIG